MGTMKFLLAPLLASSIYLCCLCCLPKAKGGRQQTNAKDIRRSLKDYLNTTEGSLIYIREHTIYYLHTSQWEYVNRLGSVLRTE